MPLDVCLRAIFLFIRVNFRYTDNLPDLCSRYKLNDKL